MANTTTEPKTRAPRRSTGNSLRKSARSTVEALESNPVAVLAGGIAVGLIAGALIPRGDREKEALRPVGKRIADGAKAAFTAAKETGKEQFSGAVMGKDAAKEGARKVLESALGAAKGSK